MADVDRSELLERYKLAYAEYRAEVALGSERQKLFMGLNPVIAALAANSRDVPIAAGALGLALIASLVGVMLVGRSHERYQHTREVLLRIARELGCESDWATTGGMREARAEPRREGPRVTTAIKWLLSLYALYDAIAIIAMLTR